MRKEVLKSLIAIKQSEILFDVIERDVELPIDRKKIITIPGVHSLRENEFPLSGGRYIDLYSIIRYPFGYLFCDYIKKSTRKGIKNVIGSCK